MPTHRHVALAAEIGMLVREPDVVQARREMLRLLTEILDGDAGSLIAVDPFAGEHRQVAGSGYAAGTARSLAVDFARTHWFDYVLDSDLPPSISEEPSQSFRRGWFYEEHVEPAGFRDGMTGALRRGGRYVGLVHLSSGRHGAFDTRARRLLASVMPALAAVADVTGWAVHAGGVPPSDRAALVSGDRIVPVPERNRPQVLEDGAFRKVVAEFRESGGRRLRVLWPLDRTWHRVGLLSPGLPGCPPGAVLVHSRPAEVPYGLTGREVEVLTRLAMGMTNDVIAQQFFLSPRTIHKHVEHVLQKTRTSSRAEAAALAVREGILWPVPGLPRRAGVRAFLTRTGG
ncbi:LuxR C-terminal-related transcriptional regulator [Actinomadura sp. WMMA1423]|uniref:helix-turn-helix transcriptional regulator n=1 Tax=Actinomadura sp. WMMA1423 TaxID=2591108 RepID=UPI001146870D|nr:LuxR C-terminal-related transcriptional regulator [Actinomadura sp. WMMA1423]